MISTVIIRESVITWSDVGTLKLRRLFDMVGGGDPHVVELSADVQIRRGGVDSLGSVHRRRAHRRVAPIHLVSLPSALSFNGRNVTIRRHRSCV